MCGRGGASKRVNERNGEFGVAGSSVVSSCTASHPSLGLALMAVIVRSVFVHSVSASASSHKNPYAGTSRDS